MFDCLPNRDLVGGEKLKIKKSVTFSFLITVVLIMPLIPVASCANEEDWYKDLIVSNIDTTHNLYRTKHTAWVTIKNIGNYPVSETFTLSLWFAIHDTQGGPDALGKIKEWDIDGLGIYPFNFKVRVYTYSWTNPDPDRYEARFSAKVDYYNDVVESDETNNWGYGEWFA